MAKRFPMQNWLFVKMPVMVAYFKITKRL